mgnify:CR=1 FL=1
MTGTLIVDTAVFAMIPFSRLEGAKIFLDGMDTLFISPATFTLTAGVHNYIVSLNGFISIQGQINIVDNQVTNLVVTLESDTSKLYKQLIVISAVGLGLTAVALLLRRH